MMRRLSGSLRTARRHRTIVTGTLIVAVGVGAWALPGNAHRDFMTSAAIVTLVFFVVFAVAWLLSRPRLAPPAALPPGFPEVIPRADRRRPAGDT
jgi:hypothetical protein